MALDLCIDCLIVGCEWTAEERKSCMRVALTSSDRCPFARSRSLSFNSQCNSTKQFCTFVFTLACTPTTQVMADYSKWDAMAREEEAAEQREKELKRVQNREKYYKDQ